MLNDVFSAYVVLEIHYDNARSSWLRKTAFFLDFRVEAWIWSRLTVYMGPKSEKSSFDNICLLWYTYRFGHLLCTRRTPQNRCQKVRITDPKKSDVTSSSYHVHKILSSTGVSLRINCAYSNDSLKTNRLKICACAGYMVCAYA